MACRDCASGPERRCARLTCSALKPQGLPAAALADLAARFALGGIDYIKDDHGLADQAYSPFAERVEGSRSGARRRSERDGARRRAMRRACRAISTACSRQIACATDVGIDTVLIAPMVAGLANFHRLVRETIPASRSSRIRAWRARRASRHHVSWASCSASGGGRRRVSQSRRPVRLFAGDLPGARAGGLGGPRRTAPMHSGAGRRHDARSRAPRCLNSMVPTSCY